MLITLLYIQSSTAFRAGSHQNPDFKCSKLRSLCFGEDSYVSIETWSCFGYFICFTSNCII